MTTAYPAHITWPILAFIAAMLLARYRYFNKTGYESAYNNLLACLLVANVLREHSVQVAFQGAGIASITTMQQASLVSLVFANAELLRFTKLWTHPAAASRRCAYSGPYIAAVMISAAFWIAATPARRAGQTLEEYGGWTVVVAWVILVSIFVVAGAMLVVNSAGEYRRRGSGHRERFLAVSGMAIGSVVVITSVYVPILAAAETLGWITVEPFLTWVHGRTIFLETVGTSLFGIVPFWVTALAYLGMDSTCSRFRKLRPLLTDVTNAAPEVIFEIPDRNSRRGWTELDLHQAVVQIRDGMLQLRPWMLPIDERSVAELCDRHRVPAKECAEAALAFQLAEAMARKSAGSPPLPPSKTLSVATSRPTDLDGEIAEIIRVAKWWAAAKTSAQLEEHDAYRV